MSKCNLEPAPGPITTVHGVVTDAVTGKPIPNLPLKIFDTFGLDGNNIFAVTSTDANGNYYLKFTPYSHLAKYVVMPGSSVANQYGFRDPAQLTLGVDNNLNIQFYKEVNLTIHLQNNSDQNKTTFMFVINCNFIGDVLFFNPPKKDTTFTIKASHLMQYAFLSDFYNGGSNDTTNVKFNQSAFIGEADTTVNIINP